MFTFTGSEGEENYELLTRIEGQMKRRFAIGAQVSEHTIIHDFIRQVSVWGLLIFFLGFFQNNLPIFRLVLLHYQRILTDPSIKNLGFF